MGQKVAGPGRTEGVSGFDDCGLDGCGLDAYVPAAVVRVPVPAAEQVAAEASDPFGIVLLTLGALLIAWLLQWHARRRGRILPHEQMALRENHNGDALMAMAQEIEDYAVWLERIGIPAGQQRRWSRICRRIAAEHLECINLLMLEDIRRAPPPSPSPGDGP